MTKDSRDDGEMGVLDELISRILAAARAVAWEVTTGRQAPSPELRDLTAAVDAHEQWRGGSVVSGEVTESPDAARHAAVLESLSLERRHYEALGDVMRRQLAVVDGRRRIVERHAPLDLEANGMRCSHCSADQAPAGWPCDDYRDAAADALDPMMSSTTVMVGGGFMILHDEPVITPYEGEFKPRPKDD